MRPASWRRTGTARLLLGVLAAVWVVGSTLAYLRPANVDPFDVFDFLWGTAFSIPFPLVGYVIARKDPGNPIGWLFLVGPITAMLGVAMSELVYYLQADTPPVVAYLSDLMFYVGLGLIASFFLLLFPTGAPPTRRWRVGLWIGAVGIIGSSFWSIGRPCTNWVLEFASDTTVLPGCREPVQSWFIRFENPFGLADLGSSPAWGVIGGVVNGLLVVAFFVGVVSLFARYRHSGPTVRAQLRWPLAVLALIAPLLVILIALDTFFGVEAEQLAALGFFVAFAGLPISIGLAITRYRLYEIDRVISRTVTYGVVVVVLAALFGVLAAAPTLVLGSNQGGETPAWVVAISTLAVAALFTPLRRRVQRVVDRRFDRARYDAQAIIDGFSVRVRDETAIVGVAAGLGEVAATVFRPASLGVWLRGQAP